MVVLIGGTVMLILALSRLIGAWKRRGEDPHVSAEWLRNNSYEKEGDRS